MRDRMRGLAWGLVAVGILTACAPTMATLPVTASAEDRRQAARCHARALDEMARGPSVVQDHLARTNTHWVSLFNPVTFAVVAVAAPVWYPIAKTKHTQRLYDDAVARCLEGGEAEWDWP